MNYLEEATGTRKDETYRLSSGRIKKIKKKRKKAGEQQKKREKRRRKRSIGKFFLLIDHSDHTSYIKMRP